MRTDLVADVVVTGLGVVSPIGIGTTAFWEALCAGISGIVQVESRTLPCRAAVSDFVARDFIRSPHLRRADDLSRMIVAAARMALDDAGVDLDACAADHVGVVVGSAIGNVRDSVCYLERLVHKGAGLASPMAFPNLVHNAPASYVAMEIGATGVNFTVADGEISGEKALALAADSIRAGRADLVVAGGGDDFIVDLVADAYRAFGLLAGTRGREARCSPYDRRRGGIALGQGAAMLVLESSESAARRGVPIYARLRGVLDHSLACGSLTWPKDVTPAHGVMQRFLGIHGDGAGVDLVVASGNGCGDPDRGELEIVRHAVVDQKPVWMTSIKGAVGEFGAAGALAAVTTCLAMKHGRVPPLCALRQPVTTNSDGGIRFCAPRSEAAEIRQALTLGMARGGGLAALLWDHPKDVL